MNKRGRQARFWRISSKEIFPQYKGPFRGCESGKANSCEFKSLIMDFGCQYEKGVSQKEMIADARRPGPQARTSYRFLRARIDLRWLIGRGREFLSGREDRLNVGRNAVELLAKLA